MTESPFPAAPHPINENEVRNRVGRILFDVLGPQHVRRKNASKLARQCAELQERFTTLITEMPPLAAAPAPQPALDAGEQWHVTREPVHGWGIVSDTRKIVGNIYREEDAARIVDDHAIARTVPGLLEALRDARASAAAVPKLVEALTNIAERAGRRECQRYSTGIGSCFKQGRRPNATLAAEKCCAPCIADEALTTVQGKE